MGKKSKQAAGLAKAASRKIDKSILPDPPPPPEEEVRILTLFRRGSSVDYSIRSSKLGAIGTFVMSHSFSAEYIQGLQKKRIFQYESYFCVMIS